MKNSYLKLTALFLLALFALPLSAQKESAKTGSTQTGKGTKALGSTAADKVTKTTGKTTTPTGERSNAANPNDPDLDQGNEKPKPNLANLENRLNNLEKDLKDNQNPYVRQGSLGLLEYLGNPFVLLAVGFLIFLAIIFHLIHLIRIGSLNRQLLQLHAGQNNLAQTMRAAGTPGKSAAVDKLTEQVSQQSQSLTQLLDRLNQMEGRLTIGDSQYRDAAHALGLAANWIGQAQLKATTLSNGGEVSEAERSAGIAMLESYRDPFRLNASRVEPITLALAELSGKLQGRSHSSPLVAGRIQNLCVGIARFDQLHSQVTAQLESLQRGTFAERSARLQADQDRLFERLDNGSMSVGQMVQKSRSLIEKHFPAEPTVSNEKSLPLGEQEANLKRAIDEAGDYLMDWYNNLYQLQAQLGQTQGSQADVETAAELAKVQQIAREALNRFDIQPEAIQIGQTSFDRRLHEAALVRPAPQYPTNTVIDVQKCGFRRMTTGEVLRRPEVVVAGTAAG